MKKRSIKGFTLIELLAVIIIMGVLMMTAIPAVTKYIENSRKDTFWQTAKSYIDASKTTLLSGDFKVNKSNFSGVAAGDDCDLPPVAVVDSTNKKIFMYYTSIDIMQIDMEKGKGKSSFNRSFGTTAGQGYVVAINRGYAASGTAKDDIYYYFVGYDAGGNGIKALTPESSLSRTSVLKGTAKSGNTAIKLRSNVTGTAADLSTGKTAKIGSDTYTIYYRLYTDCIAK